ncbi:hypothetical protein MKEN_00167600 [Mycena kentingensis (nom. inval.)]|nr:hypothetical protein MKEN_00167600 [Mycena kentingensis (nom. inval.)]
MSYSQLHTPNPVYGNYPPTHSRDTSLSTFDLSAASSATHLDKNISKETVPDRDGTKTPDMTQEEYNLVNGIVKEQTTKQKIITYAVVGFILAIVILFAVFQKKIVRAFEPQSDWLLAEPVRVLIPISLFIVVSFPPLFGHGIIAILVGVTWDLWVAFGITAAGTVLGEVINYAVFRFACKGRMEKMEKKSLEVGLMAYVVRRGGLLMVAIIRYSTVPPHYATAIFSSVGLNFFIFLFGTLIALPKQIVPVYTGYAIKSASEGDEKDGLRHAGVGHHCCFGTGPFAGVRPSSIVVAGLAVIGIVAVSSATPSAYPSPPSSAVLLLLHLLQLGLELVDALPPRLLVLVIGLSLLLHARSYRHSTSLATRATQSATTTFHKLALLAQMSEEPLRVRDAVLAKALDQGKLLFPGADVDHPQEESIENLTKDSLKSLCDKYGLARSGNKNDLKTRLKDLSVFYCAEPQRCIDSRKPRKARKHKGPREQPDTKPKKKTGASTLAARRLALMNTNVAGAGERSKDMRTQEDISALTIWTKGNMARFAYVPPKQPATSASTTAGSVRAPAEPETTILLRSIATRLGEVLDMTRPSDLAPTAPSSSVPWPQPLVPLDEPVVIPNNARVDTLNSAPVNSTRNFLDMESASTVSLSLGSGAPTFAPSALTPTPNATSPLLPADVPLPDVTMADVHMPNVRIYDASSSDTGIVNSMHANLVAGVAEPCPREKRMRSLKLGDGAIVSFDLNEIRPPVLNFSGANLPRLWQEWDDTRAEWTSSSPLVVDGKPIALKYLHQMFVNSGSWDKHKAKWNDWKHLTTAYFKTTPEHFWTRFSDESGNGLAWRTPSRIAHAREYKDEFKVKFTYRKGSQTRLIDKDDAIAKKYLQLHPDALPNVSVDDIS